MTVAVTTFGGKRTDTRTAAQAGEAQRLFGRTLTVTQGSYNTSVGASAGTHSGGGALDFSVSGLTASQITHMVACLRTVGFAAWHRLPSQGPWAAHVHAVSVGCRDLAPIAARQVEALRNGRDGLASNGPDPHAALGLPVRTWEQYLAAKAPLPWPLPWGRFYGHRAGLRGWARLRAVPSGPIVRRVNQLLLNSSSSEFTATTAAAVRSWQAKRSLPITGWVDRRTARRMGVCR